MEMTSLLLGSRTPLQNRVDPWGLLHANPSRMAAVMGNRGILHDARQQIVKRWSTKAWVACDPNYKGISRKPLFKLGSYSELFFLDEATALSAGQRPCAYCQRAKYNAFKAAWGDSVTKEMPRALSSGEIDRQLHSERVGRGISKQKYLAKVGTLPEGVIFEHDGYAYLFHLGKYWRWSFDGYAAAEPMQSDIDVEVLTPKSVVQLFAAGYRPQVHISASCQ